MRCRIAVAKYCERGPCGHARLTSTVKHRLISIRDIRGGCSRSIQCLLLQIRARVTCSVAAGTLKVCGSSKDIADGGCNAGEAGPLQCGNRHCMPAPSCDTRRCVSRLTAALAVSTLAVVQLDNSRRASYGTLEVIPDDAGAPAGAAPPGSWRARADAAATRCAAGSLPQRLPRRPDPGTPS